MARKITGLQLNTGSIQYTGLVAVWPLVAAYQGTDLFNSHDGTVVGSPSFPTNLGSPLESGMDCDGSDDRVDVPSAAALDADPMIISFWAAPDRAAMNNTIAIILDKSNGSIGSNDGWYMFFVDRDAQSETNGFNVSYDRDPTIPDWYDKATPFWDSDNPTHVLVSIDTSVSPVILVYKNGSIFTPDTNNTDGSGSHVASSIDMGIGEQDNGSNPFTGVITDVRVYSLGRASAASLASAMNAAETMWELYRSIPILPEWAKSRRPRPFAPGLAR